MGFYEEAPAGNYETQTNGHKYPVRDSNTITMIACGRS